MRRKGSLVLTAACYYDLSDQLHSTGGWQCRLGSTSILMGCFAVQKRRPAHIICNRFVIAASKDICNLSHPDLRTTKAMSVDNNTIIIMRTVAGISCALLKTGAVTNNPKIRAVIKPTTIM